MCPKILLVLSFTFLAFCREMLAQSCSIFAGNDSSFCTFPVTLQLNAQSSSPLGSCSIVEWIPSVGLSDPNILNPVANISSPIMYTVNAYIPFGLNLVVNGDFESGNTAFTNDYNYNCPFGGYIQEYQYCVTEDPQNVHAGASSCGDHTSGIGLMMVVNGATVQNSVVWEQTVPVNPGTYYMFSFWGTNWSSFTNYLPTFKIKVNGVFQGQSFSINSQQCSWKEDCLLWYSDTTTGATFQIIDQVNYYSGNDFSIDDILLQEVCLASDTISITEGALVTQSFDTIVCEGSSLSFSVAAADSYYWSPSVGLDCSTCQTVTFMADTTMTYYVSGTGNGCDFSDTFFVQVDSLPNLILPNDSFLCKGDSIQIIAQLPLPPLIVPLPIQ